MMIGPLLANEIAAWSVDGVHMVYALVEEHTGPCALLYIGGSDASWAVFETGKEGARAAAMALNPELGGYNDVALYDASVAPVGTSCFETAWDWICDVAPVKFWAGPLADRQQ